MKKYIEECNVTKTEETEAEKEKLAIGNHNIFQKLFANMNQKGFNRMKT